MPIKDPGHADPLPPPPLGSTPAPAAAERSADEPPERSAKRSADEPPERSGERSADEPPELSADDEALLHTFGQWLHEHEADELTEAELDLVLAPPPPPLSAEQLDATVDHLLRPPRRRRLRMLLSHGAVAAATVALVQVWSARPQMSDPGPLATYHLELRGGDGPTFAPSRSQPTYGPSSMFALKLRPDRPVGQPAEVVIEACREGTQCDTGVFRVRLGPELLEVNERGVLHYVAPISSVLPLAPGRWTLTFEVGDPGACLLSTPERPCHVAGRATVELLGAEEPPGGAQEPPGGTQEPPGGTQEPPRGPGGEDAP